MSDMPVPFGVTSDMPVPFGLRATRLCRLGYERHACTVWGYERHACTVWGYERHACTVWVTSDMPVPFALRATCLYRLRYERHACTVWVTSDMPVPFALSGQSLRLLISACKLLLSKTLSSGDCRCRSSPPGGASERPSLAGDRIAGDAPGRAGMTTGDVSRDGGDDGAAAGSTRSRASRLSRLCNVSCDTTSPTTAASSMTAVAIFCNSNTSGCLLFHQLVSNKKKR